MAMVQLENHHGELYSFKTNPLHRYVIRRIFANLQFVDVWTVTISGIYVSCTNCASELHKLDVWNQLLTLFENVTAIPRFFTVLILMKCGICFGFDKRIFKKWEFIFKLKATLFTYWSSRESQTEPCIAPIGSRKQDLRSVILLGSPCYEYDSTVGRQKISMVFKLLKR